MSGATNTQRHPDGGSTPARPSGSATPIVNSTLDLINGTQVAGNYLAPQDYDPQYLTVDPRTNQTFVGGEFSTGLSIIWNSNGTLGRTLQVGSQPIGSAYDSAQGEIFVADSGSDRVSVVNDTNDSVVASIRVGSDPQDVAFDPVNDTIFVSNAASNNVTVIDAATNAKLTVLDLPSNPYVGDYPAGILYDPQSNQIAVANYYDYSVSFFNATTYASVANVTTVGAPWSLALDPAKDLVFATEPYSGHTDFISAANHTVVHRIVTGTPLGAEYDAALGALLVVNTYSRTLDAVNVSTLAYMGNHSLDCLAAQYAAYDPSDHESIVSCDGNDSVEFLYPTNLTVKLSVVVGTTPASAAYDPSTGDLYVADWTTGDLWAVDDVTGAIERTAPGLLGGTSIPTQLAFDPTTDEILAVVGNGSIALISPASLSVTGWVKVGLYSGQIAYDGITGDLFVPIDTGHVTVIGGSPLRVIASIPLGTDSSPQGATYDSGTNQVFVSDGSTGNVSILNASTYHIVGNLTVGGFPEGIAYDPLAGRVFVTNAASDNVTVISDATDSVVTNISMDGRAYTLTDDPATGMLAAPLDTNDSVIILNATADDVAANLSVGRGPSGATYDSGRASLFVANDDQGTLSEISAGPTPRYAVNLTETGLAPGTSWSARLDGVTRTTTGSSISFVKPSGNYPFAVTAGSSYSATPSTGYANVRSAPVSVSILFVSLTRYWVNFSETGLPAGTDWSVVLSGTPMDGSSPALSFSEPNGSYQYRVGEIYGFTAVPATGTVMVNATSVTISIEFSRVYWNVTLSETGLPPGTVWSATVNGTTAAGSRPDLLYSEPDGNYSYSVSAVAGYSPIPTRGTIEVNGAAASLAIKFVLPTYSVGFSESGLLAGTAWTVTANGTRLTSDTSMLNFALANGTYSFSVESISGYTAEPSTGSVNVDGAPQVIPVVFAREVPTIENYSVVFTRVGSTGTDWSVTLNGTERSGPDSIAFAVPNGSYSFTVGAVPGYLPSPASGTVLVQGQNQSVIVTFTAAPTPPSISVSFVETGLASGTQWGVQVGHATLEGSAGVPLSFTTTNGTYNYRIATVAGYIANRSSGTLVVDGADVTVYVGFTPTRAPSGLLGLPGNEGWAVLGSAIATAAVVVGTAILLRRRRRASSSTSELPSSSAADAALNAR